MLTSAELSILDYIQAHMQCEFLDSIMPVITKFGNGGVLWIACAAVLLIIPSTRKAGLAMALSLIMEALLCNVILKPAIARIRPFDVNTSVSLLISAPTDYSFPSGHAGASFASVSALFFSKNRAWIPSAVAAVLISLSRLYLYVHYPTDVLAATAIGLVTGRLATAIVQAAVQKVNNDRPA